VANDTEKNGSRLPVILKPVEPSFKRPTPRNELVPKERYTAIEDCALANVMLGTNGVTYVSEKGFAGLVQLAKPKAAYLFETAIRDEDKRAFGDETFAQSSAVVALLDKRAQEVRTADTQALLQHSRDTLLAISDSDQAQSMRRNCDTFTTRELPKLKQARGIREDELTGEPLVKGAAFHHVNPKEIHTSPEDVLNPNKGRNLNQASHIEVHGQQLYDEKSFEEYKAKRKNR
jgi:hypothetical protein